jgi:hypothetical protein
MDDRGKNDEANKKQVEVEVLVMEQAQKVLVNRLHVEWVGVLPQTEIERKH